MYCALLPSPLLPFTVCVRSLSGVLRWLLCCLLCSACFAACCYCMTAGWGEIEVLMDVSSRRLALVLHRHLPTHGLLSFLSLLRAFLLNAIKRNQALTPQMLASLPSPPQACFVFVSALSRAFCEFSAVRLHRVGLGRVGFERQARSKLQQARPGGRSGRA